MNLTSLNSVARFAQHLVSLNCYEFRFAQVNAVFARNFASLNSVVQLCVTQLISLAENSRYVAHFDRQSFALRCSFCTPKFRATLLISLAEIRAAQLMSLDKDFARQRFRSPKIWSFCLTAPTRSRNLFAGVSRKNGSSDRRECSMQ
jgi:hypothetical protein